MRGLRLVALLSTAIPGAVVIAPALCAHAAESGAQLEAKGNLAFSAHYYHDAYRYWTGAAAAYATQGDAAKAAHLRDVAAKAKALFASDWDPKYIKQSGSSSSASSGGAKSGGAFRPANGSPSGLYRCFSTVEHYTGSSSIGAYSYAHYSFTYEPRGTLSFSGGRYSVNGSGGGTYSGSGSHLHLSGAPYNAAQTEYGTNGSTSMVRFIFHGGARPFTWDCTHA